MGETLGTQLAPKRSFPGVCSQVHFQVTQLSKYFVTCFTFVFNLSIFFLQGIRQSFMSLASFLLQKNVKNRKKKLKKTNFKQIYVSKITLILFCNICEITFPVVVCCLHSGTKAVSGKWMVVLTAILEL